MLTCIGVTMYGIGMFGMGMFLAAISKKDGYATFRVVE